MTKFYNYLNEQDIEEEIERVKSTLRKRSVPFLKEFDAPIYRGYKKGINDFMVRKTTRKDRKPRFIPKEIHEGLDDILKKLYGWKPRSNGVFTGDEHLAAKFGQGISKTYMFFPIGKYEYIWTTRHDTIYYLYDELTKYAKKMNISGVSKEEFDDLRESFDDVKEQLFDLIKSNVYSQSGLNKIVLSNEDYEAIFRCDSYYLVEYDVFMEEEITKFMKSF